MASKITSSPVTEKPKTQNEPERLFMQKNLLEAAINGDETDLKKLLGLDDDELEHPPHTKVSVEDDMGMQPSDCLRSITGMEDTILHILSANGHQNLLFAIGTKDSLLLHACNARRETPFHHAARFGHNITISELIRCAKLAFGKEELIELLRQKNFFGETALHEAARHGHGDVVSTLMEEDVELAGLVNKDSASPLYLATVRGSLKTVKKMVAKMLTHQITSEYYSGPKKQTALHAAVLHNPELTEELLKLNSKEPLCKEADETGRTPLHLVVSTGNCKIAKLLLDKDPSLAYTKDSDGSFPVHIAVQMGHVRVIFLLLERCLDSGQLLDGNGRNFLHIAIEAKRSGIIGELLEDSKKKLPISNWKEMFNIMFKTMDNKGNTPLHFAAQNGSFRQVDILFKDNKFDLSLQNQDGLTALDILLIQNRKFATTQGKYNFEERYIRSEGNHFSAAWLEDYSKDHMSETELSRGAKQDHSKDHMSESELNRCTKQDHGKDHMSETELTRGAKQDHTPTTDSTGPNKSSESVTTKAQLVGLGSVLIATVSFAAAFTLPGGTNQDTGTPILGRKYLFKAFVLADFAAFFLSFISTMLLIRSSINQNPDRMKLDVDRSLRTFRYATKCMVMVLALDLYLVLAPVSNTGKIIIVFSGLLILNDQKINRNKPTAEELFIKKLLSQNRVDTHLQRYKSKHWYTSLITYILLQRYKSTYWYTKMKTLVTKISSHFSVYILFPLIFNFVFALI